MKMTKIFIFKLSFIKYFVLLISCASIEAQTKYFSLSETNLDIEIPLASLEKILNERAPFNLYSDTSFKNNNNDGLKCQIFKKSPFRVSNLKDTIYFTLPLNAWIEKEWNTMGIKTKHSSNFEVTFQIIAFPELLPTWKIKPKIKVLGFIWAKEPYIDIMGFDFSVAPIVEKEINKKIPLITKVIDSIASSALDFQEYTKSSINEYSFPMAIDDESKLWLVSNPKAFKATPFKIFEDYIALKLAIIAEHQVIGVDSLNYKYQEKKLPKLNIVNNIKDTSSYKIHHFISYKVLQKLISDRMLGQEILFDNDKYAIKLNQIELFPDSNRLGIKMLVSGDFNGTLELFAFPFLDSNYKELRLKDIDFNFKTKNLLHKFAQWIFNQKIEQKIAENFTYPYTSELESIKNRIIIKMNTPFNKIIENSGVIYDLNVKHLNVTKDGVEFIANAKAKLQLKIKSQ